MPPPQRRHRQRPRPNDDWDGDVQDLECLGNGVSGIVFAIDERRVAKIHLGTPRSTEDFETERSVYRRFNERLREKRCEYVLRCFDTEHPRGLVFERCNETLRSRLRRDEERDEEQVSRWAKQAAKGLAWVHDCGVIQGDVGCHNMLLDSHDTIKLADFAGSSIDDSEVSINYEVRSRLPNISKPTKKSDVFALGSAMYEMATGHPPYAKMSYSTIQNLYRKEKFPDDVDGIPILGKIIRKCWEQRFDTAHDVVRALGKTESQHRRPSQLQQRPEVFVDSGIWIPEQPEMVEIEESSSRTSRRHPATYVHQTSQRRHRPRERQVERFPEREKRKKHSQGAFSSWFNKSISTWTGPSKSSREKEFYY